MNRRRPLGAETVTHTYQITPNDPYDFRMLDFSVLASRGYPVSLQPASRAVVEQERLRWTGDRKTGIAYVDDHMKARFDYYKQWMVPSVHHPDMRVLNAYRDGSPMVFKAPDEVWNMLDQHPAEQLVKPVCEGYPGRVHQYHQELLCGTSPVTARPIEVLGFTGACFVKAAERARIPGVGSIPETSLREVTAQTKYQQFAQKLTDRGIRAVGCEALAGLINDYYMLVEQLVPEFAAQKALQPQLPPTPPIEY
jgi:hypothetical protein